ncbi:MAG: ribosomal maturation YjgA family protein [Allorhizobium sp.]|uniref:ribosomal maturation YjgA family protein n=1 Tax=Allorhizobium sp. TaxID=633478 RepID=UPI004033E8F6
MDEIKASTSLRIRRLGIALAIIACGLGLRLGGYEIGLPYFLVKYGGSTLWGAMVFFLIAMLLPRQSIGRLAFLALVIAALTELSRLYHTPWLDEFRLTLAGALLLGRIFSWWNIVAYGLGIALAALFEARHLARSGQPSD